jgi:hypothetical protein
MLFQQPNPFELFEAECMERLGFDCEAVEPCLDIAEYLAVYTNLIPEKVPNGNVVQTSSR